MKSLILIVGEHPLPTQQLESIAKSLEYDIVSAPDHAAALSTLTETRPKVLLLGKGWYQKGEPAQEGLIEALRGDWRLHDLPLLAAVDEGDDQAVREAFRRGCDDILLPRVEEYSDKLRALSQTDPVNTQSRNKSILYVESSRLHRVVFSRILEAAGYQLTTVETEAEVRTHLSAQKPDLVLLDLSLLQGDPYALAEEIHKAGIPLLGLSRTSLPRSTRRRATDTGISLFFEKSLPPEDLLFLVNDLLLSTSETRRQSQRRLWSEVIRFAESRVGFSYNLSQRGIFIRTLAPPRLGAKVSIETAPTPEIPPLSALGRVVWVKPYTPRASRSYPPGFGVAFESLRGPEEQNWAQVYDSIL